jgi:hypothetical protein
VDRTVFFGRLCLVLVRHRSSIWTSRITTSTVSDILELCTDNDTGWHSWHPHDRGMLPQQSLRRQSAAPPSESWSSRNGKAGENGPRQTTWCTWQINGDWRLTMHASSKQRRKLSLYKYLRSRRDEMILVFHLQMNAIPDFDLQFGHFGGCADNWFLISTLRDSVSSQHSYFDRGRASLDGMGRKPFLNARQWFWNTVLFVSFRQIPRFRILLNSSGSYVWGDLRAFHILVSSNGSCSLLSRHLTQRPSLRRTTFFLAGVCFWPNPPTLTRLLEEKYKSMESFSERRWYQIRLQQTLGEASSSKPLVNIVDIG